MALTLNTISKYLSKDVINSALKDKLGSDDVVQSMNVTRAAAAGEGLLGAVYRITIVTATGVTTSFVAKGIVSDVLLRNSLSSETYFKREILFFSKILPTLRSMQKNLGAKEDIQNNIPICYNSFSDGLNDYLLLEDLVESGYETVPDNPSKLQICAILNSLAHLHANSMALRSKEPELFWGLANQLTECYYSPKNRSWYSNYLQNAIDINMKAMEELESPNSIYYKKFVELIAECPYGQLIELVENKGNHPVFCHGDVWLPNFLCSKNRAVMIDFQTFRCASIATDVSYIIILNFCKDKNEFMAVLRQYYDALVYYLRDMGMDASKEFSWDDLTKEMQRFGRYGLLASLTSIPLLGSDRCDTHGSFEERFPDMETIPLEDLWTLSLLKEQQKTRLHNALKVAVDVGLI